MTAPQIASPWYWSILSKRRPLYVQGEFYVPLPCGFGHAGLGHFFPDAGECRFAGFFLSFALRHTSMMTERLKPFCSIWNRGEFEIVPLPLGCSSRGTILMSKRVDNARLSCRVPHALTVFLSCAVRYGE